MDLNLENVCKLAVCYVNLHSLPTCLCKYLVLILNTCRSILESVTGNTAYADY